MIFAPLSPFAAEQPSVLWHMALKWLSKTPSPPSFAQESFSSAPGVPGIDFEQSGIHGKVSDYSHFLLNFLLLFLWQKTGLTPNILLYTKSHEGFAEICLGSCISIGILLSAGPSRREAWAQLVPDFLWELLMAALGSKDKSSAGRNTQQPLPDCWKPPQHCWGFSPCVFLVRSPTEEHGNA